MPLSLLQEFEQADDDGVLNPANIELSPGTIIPKAVGSQGLKPLDMPGRFDVSELVLKDLRDRIRQALLADKLGSVVDRKMTATEVLERSSQIALLLGGDIRKPSNRVTYTSGEKTFLYFKASWRNTRYTIRWTYGLFGLPLSVG